jgi:putative peptide zinc metalloprotease protein
VTIVESHTSVWEVLAGRAPGKPTGPADPGLWRAVSDRLNPARARPRLRDGLEVAELVSARGSTYVMLRSPDRRDACYVRLTPEEWALAELMDGDHSVARLVGEFARITGRLAPEQVTRVVADLAGNRMLEELPVDAFKPLERMRAAPLMARYAAGLLAFARGRRVVLAGIDPLVSVLYMLGGRLLFTRVFAALLGLVGLAGAAAFVLLWFRADQSVFLAGDSYLLGALVLIGLNVVALACHELGHALAVKHAGRRVPAAGFLIYFGIPSVFVDTTDVWMAGRRARIITTAAGPATGLVLAGASSLVALAVPPLAPLAFKLAFAWYLNALFNLNPFLALDGYYLLMDWVEVPNLRARAMAWIGARLRRRPPRFGELDREGRIIALYGMLAMVWLLIAVNIFWRLYVDRLAGLGTGLWHTGWAGRLLLAAVIVLLTAPLVYVILGRIGRRWRAWRRKAAEAHVHKDLPRRLAALRASALGSLHPDALAGLARDARWVRPVDGRPLIERGAAMLRVFVVVAGVAEARRPGDPGGVIRQRVGAGGVVGLANVITGNPSSLTWHAIGATLLAVPAPALVAAVGQLPAPPPGELAELEDLLDESPQFATLSAEAYLGLTTRAVPVPLPPGGQVVLPGPADAVLVASGTLTRYDGYEVKRGNLLGPFGNDEPGEAAVARTPARVWLLPELATLTPVPRSQAPVTGTGEPRASSASGLHTPGGYPPLAVPPGPPPADLDPEVDSRFERGLWWLLLLFLLFGLLLSGANLWPAPAWAEMPSDRAMLTVTDGTARVTVDGQVSVLDRNTDRYVGSGDRIVVSNKSVVRLVFRGGAVSVLCADTSVTLGTMVSPPGHPVTPTAVVRISQGRLLANTESSSSAFRPLSLRVDTDAGPLLTDGAVRLTAEPSAALVASGSVSLNGARLPASGPPPACGDGTALPVGADASREPPTIVTDAPSLPSLSPSESASSSEATPTTTRSTTRPPTTTPGTTPPATPTQTTTPTTAPPNQPPVLTNPFATPARVCRGEPISIGFSASDPDDPTSTLSGTVNGSPLPGFQGSFDTSNVSIPDGSVTVTFNFRVTDPDGLSDTGTATATVLICQTPTSPPPGPDRSI